MLAIYSNSRVKNLIQSLSIRYSQIPCQLPRHKELEKFCSHTFYKIRIVQGETMSEQLISAILPLIGVIIGSVVTIIVNNQNNNKAINLEKLKLAEAERKE